MPPAVNRAAIPDVPQTEPSPFEVRQQQQADLLAATAHDFEGIETPGFFQPGGLGVAAVTEYTLIPQATRMFNRDAGVKADPAWEPRPEDIKSLREEFSQPDVESIVESSLSAEHFQALKDDMRRRRKNQEIIQSRGWSGVAAAMLASVLDPAAIALTLGTETLAAPVILANTSTRLGRASRTALLAGTSNVAVEGALYGLDPTKEAVDLLYALGAGLALGGALGSLKRGPARTTEAQRRMQEFGHRLQEAAEEIREPSLKELRARVREIRKNLSDLRHPRARQLKEIKELEERIGQLAGADPKRASEAPTITGNAPRVAPGNEEAVARLLTKGDSELNGFQINRLKKDKGFQEFFARLRAWGINVSRVQVRGNDIGDTNVWIEAVKPDGSMTQWRGTLGDRGKMIASGIDELDPETFARLRATREELAEEAKLNKAAEAAHSEEHVVPVPDEDSVGAMRNLAQNWDPDDELAWREAEIAAPKGRFGYVRFSAMGRLSARARNPITRMIARMLVPDAVPIKGVRAGRSATEEATMLQDRDMLELMDVYKPAFRAWLKETGSDTIAKRLTFDEMQRFGRLVSERIRSGKPSGSASVDAAAGKMVELNRRMVDRLKRAGVEGAEDLDPNLNYMARILDSGKVEQLVREYGKQAIERMLARAIYKGRGNLDFNFEDAVKIAEGYIETARRLKPGGQMDFSIRGARDMKDLFEKMLQEETGLSKEKIEGILGILNKADKGGDPANLKYRTLLDETHTERLVSTKDGSAAEIGPQDFWIDDAALAQGIYMRRMNGRIALANQGIKGDSDWNRLMDKLRKSRVLDDETSIAKHDKDIESIQNLYKSALGLPIKETGDAWRMIGDLNFVRVMGQVGLSQMGEMGSILGHMGWDGFRQLPEVAKLLRRAKLGDLGDTFVQELEALTGIGAMNDAHYFPHSRLDDWAQIPYDARTVRPGLAGVDNALQRAKHVVAQGSGFIPITQLMQRLTMRAMAQKFARLALTEAELGKGVLSEARLNTLGLTVEDARAIGKQIAKYGGRENGATGAKVVSLNMGAWDRQDLAHAFAFAVNRATRRLVQEGDVGTLGMWMHNDVSRMVLQFRKYVITAYEKQLLHNVALNDRIAWQMFAISNFMAGLTYIGRTYMNAQGRSDRDKKRYLEERLTPERIGGAAFQMSAFGTVTTIPMDAALQIAGYDPVFSLGRGSGMNMADMLGNPTFSLGDKIMQGTAGVVQAARSDKEFEKKHLDAFYQTLPFQNMYGMRNIYELGAEHLNLPDNRR